MNRKTKQFNLLSGQPVVAATNYMPATNNHNVMKVASFSGSGNRKNVDRVRFETEPWELASYNKKGRRAQNQILSSEGIELGTPGQYRPRQDLIYKPSESPPLAHKGANLLRCHSEMVRKIHSTSQEERSGSLGATHQEKTRAAPRASQEERSRRTRAPPNVNNDYLELTSNRSNPPTPSLTPPTPLLTPPTPSLTPPTPSLTPPKPQSNGIKKSASDTAMTSHLSEKMTSPVPPARRSRRKTPSMLLDLVVNDVTRDEANYFETSSRVKKLAISSPTEPRHLSSSSHPFSSSSHQFSSTSSQLSSSHQFSFSHQFSLPSAPTSSCENLASPKGHPRAVKTLTLPVGVSPREMEKQQTRFHFNIFRKLGRKLSNESMWKSNNQVDPLDPHPQPYIVNDRLSVDDPDDDVTSGDSKKKKEKKKKSKPPSRHGSDAKNSDKVRTKLKKFIGRRPTMESLQERGIIKESVFGCPLDKLCEKEQSHVPNFIRTCVEEVEKRGLDVDGIYRVSGNLSHVQKLRYMVDRDETIDLSDPQWEDIHLVTGALKMFLRELPEPVIPFNFFDKFIAACKIQDEEKRITSMKSLVRVLPKANGKTLKYLMNHFVRVVEHSVQNRMQVQNIAIVFGPTLLLKPPEEGAAGGIGGTTGHMAVYMVYQNQIVDYMLTSNDAIFGGI